MADGYSVGNLKIAFNALDQTSDDFKKLATNLRAITNLINRISTADLSKFTANVKEITKAFNPFLTKITKASVGLTEFDAVTKAIGVKNISSVVDIFDEITKAVDNTTQEVKEFTGTIPKGQGDAENKIEKTVEAVKTLNDQLLYQQQYLKELNRAYSVAYKANDVAKMAKISENIESAKSSISTLKDKIKADEELKSAKFGVEQVVQQTTQAINEQISSTYRALTAEEQKKVAQYEADKAARKALITYYEAELAMGASGKQARQYAKELEELRKQDGKVGKKSGFQKFLGQVKRVAVYRSIRSGIKTTTSAFKEGIGALAQFDSGVNKTMSQLTTSFTVIKLSVSAALLPLLESITPIVQQISVGFANMANVVSASMSKTGEYTKINTDRLLAYNKAANLFDFDKFRALNKGNDATNLLSTEKIGEGNAELENTKNIIQSIKGIIGSVFEIIRGLWQVIQPLLTNVVLPVLGAILPLISEIIRLVASVLSPILEDVGRILSHLFDGILGDVVKQIIIAISFIIKILKGDLVGALEEVGNIFASIPNIISGAIELFINAAIKIINTFTSNLSKTWTWLNYFGLDLKEIPTIPYIKMPRIQYLANGGMPDKGSLFVAGEGGAEFVYNMPSGQSGVANVQQIAQAMKAGCLAALQEYGASRGSDLDFSVDLDGEQIYRNTTSHAKKHGYAWRKV